MGVLIALCALGCVSAVVITGFVLAHVDELRREVADLRADVDVLNGIADGHAHGAGATPAGDVEQAGRPLFWRF